MGLKEEKRNREGRGEERIPRKNGNKEGKGKRTIEHNHWFVVNKISISKTSFYANTYFSYQSLLILSFLSSLQVRECPFLLIFLLTSEGDAAGGKEKR